MVTETHIDEHTSSFGKWRTLWVGLVALLLLTPVGLLAPGTAWGEWGAEELAGLGLSFIPRGLEQLSSFWASPFPDYSVPALGNADLGYVLSALVGVLSIVVVFWLFSFLVSGGRKSSA
jgi:PDGLE domain